MRSLKVLGLACWNTYKFLIDVSESVKHWAWASKIRKFGTFVIFLRLPFGMLGFVAKGLIRWVIET